MIPVVPASEPHTFEEAVRQPGLRALEKLAERHYGGVKEAIPSNKFPAYWRHSLKDLLKGYHRICSCLCLYIPPGTGARSVGHMIAKSQRWEFVYEWCNYRLACSLMNARKGAVGFVLDPFDVEDGWFVLELVDFQVLPGDDLSDAVTHKVQATIRHLRLNDDECRSAREEYAEDYRYGKITFDYLSRHAPFVANELHRQGRLRASDT